MYVKTKKFSIGDIIIVQVLESNTAQQTTKTSTSSSNDASINAGPGEGSFDFFPLFKVEGTTENSFTGDGNTQRNGKIKTTIAVRIKKKMEDGNFMISGEKTININNEKEVIKLSGYIRPSDISEDNTVKSVNIAEASLEYVGSGNMDAARKPGIISKFLNWLF